VPSPFDATTYTVSLIRFWRIPWHRLALQVLAEAISPSAEADYLTHEWTLISSGNRAEFALRRQWALKVGTAEQAGEAPVDPWAWQDTPTWQQIGTLYGPHSARHHACLCKWLHGRAYPVTVSAHGGGGDAGGRARRLIADLDSAVALLPVGLNERGVERHIATTLGWAPTTVVEKGAA
jgi:hypothetical protein